MGPSRSGYFSDFRGSAPRLEAATSYYYPERDDYATIAVHKCHSILENGYFIPIGILQGHVDAKTTRSGKLRVVLEADDREGLGKLWRSIQRRLR